MRRRSHCIGLSAALAACGGGGGGGGDDSTPPTQLTLSSTTVSASYRSNTGALNAPSSTVTATIAHAPSAQVYIEAGDVVSITASQPVASGYSVGGAFASNVTQTTTTWTGTMQSGTSTPGQTGTVDLSASYLPDPQFSSALAFDVTQ